MCREFSRLWFISDMKSGGGNWAGGKCSINDGGNVDEYWREANDENQISCLIVASTNTGGSMD